MVGLNGLEPSTSRLSGVRSNQLSYRPQIFILFLYGIIPTFQPEASFGKVYAAYGGVFIALSILWGWLVDGLRPDMYDIIGGLVCLVGVYIIMYAPR